MVSASPAPIESTSVLIIGDGVIGLSTAYALGRAGADCIVVGAWNPGIASLAAAGLLLPDLDALPPAVRPFFAASLDAYPAFIDGLRSFDPSLRLIEGLTEITSQTPAPGHHHPRDGAIDNVKLTHALRAAASSAPSVSIIGDDPVVGVDLTGTRAFVTTRSGRRIAAERIVVAAGAWAPQIAGLPRALPVHPLKGQMLALAASPLDVPVVGDDVYLVPRGNETLVGATVEHAGFDLTINPDAIARLREAAIRVVPALADAAITRSWAGTRPATPDMFPILGAEPSDSRLIYACGHAKNGILLAPATGDLVRRLAVGAEPSVDISAFRATRFSTGAQPS